MKRILLKQIFLLALALLSMQGVKAQDIRYVRKQLARLCSPEFHGRAYYKKGDSLAADYLAQQYETLGLDAFGSDYFQPYTFNVNSLDRVSVQVNGTPLEFGTDFMMDPSSGSLRGSFKPVLVDASLMKSPFRMLQQLSEAGDDLFIVLDSMGLNNPELYRFVKTMAMTGQMGIAGMMELCPHTPIGRVGRRAYPGPCIQVNRKAVPGNIEEVRIDIQNNYHENYQTRNVIGFIPGQSEKFIVFTAHYDMIGSFGEGSYFPGAYDNGSGTAMVLDLARHYSQGKKPYYSLAFMMFSGEEAGLMGSSHYVRHPLFPMEQIKLVINLDMVGTGQQGTNLLNGPQRPMEAALVKKINEEKHYMVDIEERDGKPNSDHWPFHAKGVPAFCFLTKGRSAGVHNIHDTPEMLPLYGYENLFKLVVDLSKELEKTEIN